MATKKEEEDEQAFFAEQIKEQAKDERKIMSKSAKTTDTHSAENDQEPEHVDSLGQPNPAFNLEKKNLEEAVKRQEEKDKEEKKAEKSA